MKPADLIDREVRLKFWIPNSSIWKATKDRVNLIRPDPACYLSGQSNVCTVVLNQ